MDRQEVNLYTLEFRQDDQPLSSKRIVQCAVATFVVLMVVEAVTWWRLQNNQSQLLELQQEQQVVAQRLQTLKQNRPLSQREKLEADIARLRDQVLRREELRAIISGQDLGNAEGFSKQLTAMARQTVSDIALSKFRLLQGGGYVELEGETRLPEAVPLYLQNLRTEESFGHVRFGVLSISREETTSNKRSSGRELQFSVGQSKEPAS